MSLTETRDRILEHAEVLVKDTTAISRDEWLRLRRLGIGGSDAAAALGLSPWTSPYALWADKRGAGVEIEVNEPMRWGTVLEESIGLEFGEREGLRVAPYKTMVRSREWPWMVVNLDLISEDVACVEVKNVGHHSAAYWGENTIPEHYAIQGLHEMAVTGTERVHFPVLVGGQELIVRTMERDQKQIETLAELERRFFEQVEEGTPPAIDGHKDTAAILASLYADPVKGSEVQLPAEVLDWIADREALLAQIEPLEERAKARENAIKAALGDAEIGKVGEKVVVTWKRQTRTGFDKARLEAEHPCLIEQYKTQSAHRRLLVK